MLKKKGKLALHSTILSGNTDLVKNLLKGSVDVNQLDGRNNTPLHIAAMKGYTEIIKILLKKGANPNLRNKHNSIPLHFAVQLNHTDAAKLLIKSKSDLNAKDRYSETPLHFAVSNDNEELARELIDAGAKVNLTNSQFFTALAVAKNNGNEDLAEYLESEGAVAPKKVVDTAKIAFKSSNIYRKICVILFSALMVSAAVVATMMSEGRFLFSVLVAVVASLGFAIVCFEKPYRRIKHLESKVLNELMSQEEFELLLFSNEISIQNSKVSSERFLVGNATNDNELSGKITRKNSSSQTKISNNR